MSLEYSGGGGGGGNGGSTAEDLLSYRMYVKNEISDLYTTMPNATLTTTGATDLQTAIDALSDGETLEVKANATYDPITINSGKAFRVRVAYGYDAILSGERCIRLKNGCSHVLLSGFTIKGYSLGAGHDENGEGQAITFEDLNMKCDNIIFHDIHIKEIAALGAAVILSYHQTRDGDDYTTPNELDEFSEKIAFVGCNLYAASSGVETGAILARGCDILYLKRNNINGANDPLSSVDCRGILVQNSFNILIEENSVYNTKVPASNGECIKIDRLGAPSYFNTCWICDNVVRGGIEGIDVDDAVEALVENNRVWDCTDEGISIDNDSTAKIVNNVVFGCTDGIRCEDGSTYELHGNNTFDNFTNNIRLDDGGSPDDTNIHDPLSANGVVGELTTYQTRWDDIIGPLIVAKIGPNAPTLTVFRGDVQQYAFTIGDEVFSGFHIPHGYKPGTKIYPHIHFSTDGTETNTVKWEIEFTLAKDGGTFGVSPTVITIEKAPDGSAYGHFIEEYATGILGSLLEPDTLLQFKLKRITNSGTDNTDVVFGFNLDIHFQSDNIGTLNKFPPFNNRS